jgi:hypothetical protein
MKKRVLLSVLFISIIFILSFVISAQTGLEDEQEKVNDAYECLEDRVEGECSSLSTEEKIFSLLAIDQCQAEVMGDSLNDGECWPASNCRLKTTAQSALALDNTGVGTNDAEEWLLSQNLTPTELTWYLEIESPEATSCTLSYSGSSSNINIGEDKKISNSAGTCLRLAQDDYWMRISPSCYDQEFQISCDQKFLTTLLFRKTTSSTIHVLEKSSSAAAGGTTTEKVDSYCFAESGSCDYEGSLWAALVLDSLGREVSSFLPYLIVMAEDNERYIPEAFLYFLTSNAEYRSSLLLGQKSSKWWMESGDKFYDTALALYPFQHETIQEKTNSKIWLLDVQDSEGCWERNTRNTAFILASIWPREFGGGAGEEELPDCEAAGYFCMSGASCEGDIYSDYDCPALFKCCSVPQPQETCAELGGKICASSQTCIGGNVQDTLDLSLGEECCIGGSCGVIDQTPDSECELNSGVCRTYGCTSEEEESTYLCDFTADTCCVSESKTRGSYWWVWLLVILIILVILGIIFRDKLRLYFFKGGFKFGRGRGSKRYEPPRPPLTQPYIQPRPTQRRILPRTRRSPARPRRARSRELDDVLKKLKDMGK